MSSQDSPSWRPSRLFIRHSHDQGQHCQVKRSGDSDIPYARLEKDLCDGAVGLYNPAIILLTFVFIIDMVGDLASSIYEMVFGVENNR